VAQAVLPDKLIEGCMMWSCDLDDRKGRNWIWYRNLWY